MKRTVLAIWVSLSLAMLGVPLLNATVYFASGASWAKDVAAIGELVAMVVLAAVFYYRPMRVTAKALVVLTGAFLAFASIVGAVSGFSPLGLALSAVLCGLGSAWVFVQAVLSLTSLSRKRSLECILGALVASQVALGALLACPLPPVAHQLAFLVVSLAAMGLSYRPACETVDLVRSQPLPAEARVTNPFSYLSLSHPFYVTIALFSGAFGFVFMLTPEPMQLAASVFAAVPFVPLLLFLFGASKSLDANVTFSISAFFVIMGFVLLLSADGRNPVLLASSVFSLGFGFDLFSVLVIDLVVAVGARNISGAVTAIALSQAFSLAGIMVGAWLENATMWLSASSAVFFQVPTIVVACAIVAFSLITCRALDFEKVIRGVVSAVVNARGALVSTDAQGEGAEGGSDALPKDQSGAEAQASVDALEASCDCLAEACHLTKREREVLGFLARGRTSAVIQEKLVLSRNTVKTHVRNIYMKTDVHSQQELIDKVEAM